MASDADIEDVHSLVNKVRDLNQICLKSLLDGTNVNHNCLNNLLHKKPSDLQVIEKYGSTCVSFIGSDDIIDRQSLEKLSENFAFLSSAATSSTGVKYSEEDSARDLCESPSCGSENNIKVNSAVSESEVKAKIPRQCKRRDASLSHDPANKIHERGIQEGVVLDDDDFKSLADPIPDNFENEAVSNKALDESDRNEESSFQNKFFSKTFKNSFGSSSSASSPHDSPDEDPNDDLQRGLGDIFHDVYHTNHVNAYFDNLDNKAVPVSNKALDEPHRNEESSFQNKFFSKRFENSSYSSNSSSASSPHNSSDEDPNDDPHVSRGFFSSGERYSFEKFKKKILQEHEKLEKYYNKIQSTLKCKAVVVYVDSIQGDFSLIRCNSRSEANDLAFGLKEAILKDPFAVVLIKTTAKNSGNKISKKQLKVKSVCKVGQENSPTVFGALHTARDQEQCDFPMKLNLDTGADSGSIGYKYDTVKNFILTAATINGCLEPAVLCKVSIGNIMGEKVQVFDIDEDPNWNAIGLGTLKNYVICVDFKTPKVIMANYEDVVTNETDETVEVTFPKNVISPACDLDESPSRGSQYNTNGNSTVFQSEFKVENPSQCEDRDASLSHDPANKTHEKGIQEGVVLDDPDYKNPADPIPGNFVAMSNKALDESHGNEESSF